MAKPFPADAPFLNGYYAPLHLEAEAANLPITGVLPPALQGTLYRIGPNPQFAPRGRHHWFAGDGMVHAFTLGEGRAAYRNRYVRTPKWLLENAAGEGLSSGGMGPSPLDDPRITQLRSSVANTNVLVHGGRLLALEEAHAPFELDAQTLATHGEHRFGGQLQGPFTAHPKIDPVSGEMVAFGYQTEGFGSLAMAAHVVGADGQLLRTERFQAPMACMVHDFCVTARHLVFPLFPLTASVPRAMQGRPPYAWEPELGTRVGIMPRAGGSGGAGGADQMRWFRGPACFVYHPLNAFDTPDGKLICDMVQYDAPPGYPLADGTPVKSRQHGARLVRWTFDLNSADDSYTETPLCDLALEFPRFDERFAMQPHRHGFFVTGTVNPEVGAATEQVGIAHVDMETGATARWLPAPGDCCGEPVFVPRAADAPEGDGWLLTVVYRRAEGRSDLAVLDARDISQGPVALVHLSHRIPAGFHGNWVNV